jgi:hypothetical protein
VLCYRMTKWKLRACAIVPSPGFVGKRSQSSGLCMFLLKPDDTALDVLLWKACPSRTACIAVGHDARCTVTQKEAWLLARKAIDLI